MVNQFSFKVVYLVICHFMGRHVEHAFFPPQLQLVHPSEVLNVIDRLFTHVKQNSTSKHTADESHISGSQYCPKF